MRALKKTLISERQLSLFDWGHELGSAMREFFSPISPAVSSSSAAINSANEAALGTENTARGVLGTSENNLIIAPKIDSTATAVDSTLPLIVLREGETLRQISLNGHATTYAFKRAKRRSIGFVIDEGVLRVKCPRWVTIVQTEAALHEKANWILTKQKEWLSQKAKRILPEVQWQEGASLPFMGQHLILNLQGDTQQAAVVLQQQTLFVNLPSDASIQQIKDRVMAWLQQQALQHFATRLSHYAEKLAVQYTKLSLTQAQSRWGSCTVDGHIRLNWRLIHFAPEVIDYVVAHELAHLKEMNHSPRFWATVQSIFPGFEQARKTLRREAYTLPIF